MPVQGFANLVRRDGNPREKQTLRVSWQNSAWRAAVTGTYISDFIQTSLTLDDGSVWTVPSMQTYNASVDYSFDSFGDTESRIRFGVVNMFDERAPLTDTRFGYWSDVHSDLPRSYYVDLRVDFF